jgi:hypothetical protein
MHRRYTRTRLTMAAVERWGAMCNGGGDSVRAWAVRASAHEEDLHLTAPRYAAPRYAPAFLRLRASFDVGLHPWNSSLSSGTQAAVEIGVA